MLDETKEQREPCLFEPAPLQAHSRSARSGKRWLGDRLLGKWPRDSPIALVRDDFEIVFLFWDIWSEYLVIGCALLTLIGPSWHLCCNLLIVPAGGGPPASRVLRHSKGQWGWLRCWL